jgi:hypothetical protein
MTATDIFRKNHRTIRKALVSLDRALLMQSPNWAIIAKNLAGYLEIELREYWGSEERWIFKPLAETGPDAAGVVQMKQSLDLDVRLNEFKAPPAPHRRRHRSVGQEKGVVLGRVTAAEGVWAGRISGSRGPRAPPRSREGPGRTPRSISRPKRAGRPGYPFRCVAIP